MILAGTLYRFTSPPSQKDVRIAMFANLEIAQSKISNVGRYEAINRMTLASHTSCQIRFNGVVFADLLHAGETPARDTSSRYSACSRSLSLQAAWLFSQPMRAATICVATYHDIEYPDMY